MKKVFLSVCLLLGALAAKADWTFQFKFTTSNGLNYTSSPFTTNGFQQGYHILGSIDMTSYLCEGDQFKLENFSSGNYPCGSGASTINSSTIWDAAFGRIYTPQGGTPSYNTIGSMLLNDQTWPQSPNGLMVTVPVDAAAPLGLDPNTNPAYVYYLLAVAPGMGCNYFGLNNGNAACTSMLYFTIKVRRAPKALPDLTVCPGTTITNALLGIPSGVTADPWVTNDPRLVTPETTTNYTVTLSNTNNCTLVDKVKITVNNPSTELFPTPSTTICPSQLPLMGSGVPVIGSKITVNGVLVYDASTSYADPAYIDSNLEFRISAAGTYTIVYEYYNADYNSVCVKNYTVFVPKAPKLLGQNLSLCNNQFGQLCAPSGSGGIFYTYKWYYNDVQLQQNVLVSNNQCFTPNAFGTYTMFMTNQYGCTYSNTYNLSLSPSANPDANFTYTKGVNTQVTYVATPSALNTTNKWELILSNASGAETSTLQTIYTSNMASATFSPRPLNQYYKIRHTVSSTPCNVNATKAFLDYALPLPGKSLRTISGSTEEQQASELTVFPNPSNGIFTIVPAGFEGATMDVYDMTGKKVHTSVLSEGHNQSLDLSGYSKGVYLLNIISNDKSVSKRIVLE